MLRAERVRGNLSTIVRRICVTTTAYIMRLRVLRARTECSSTSSER